MPPPALKLRDFGKQHLCSLWTNPLKLGKLGYSNTLFDFPAVSMDIRLLFFIKSRKKIYNNNNNNYNYNNNNNNNRERDIL